MKLLHGTNVVINRPDLNLCHSHNDFGKGFYLTPSWNRAWEMGRRRRDFLGGNIVVNAFRFSKKEAIKAGLKVVTFDGFTTDWAEFIIRNRDENFFAHKYDIVIGPVADAILDQEIFKYKRVYKADYLKKENLEVFIKNVSQYGTSYIQYCFCTDSSLKFLNKE